jgi:hypothetical protein
MNLPAPVCLEQAELAGALDRVVAGGDVELAVDGDCV